MKTILALILVCGTGCGFANSFVRNTESCALGSAGQLVPVALELLQSGKTQKDINMALQQLGSFGIGNVFCAVQNALAEMESANALHAATLPAVAEKRARGIIAAKAFLGSK